MTESFSFEELEFFTVGTLGPRGERVFYLQGRAEGRLVSLKLEKQQVAALADYLDRVLDDLPGIDESADSSPAADMTLREPVVPAWTVGALGVAYAADDDRLVLLAEELLETDEDEDEDDDDQEPARARFSLHRSQVVGLISRARMIVAAGRTPCLYCGSPLDPRHDDWCACSN